MAKTHRRTQGGLGYDISGRRNGGGAFVPHVIVRCAKCPSRLEFISQGASPPEMVAKHIRGKGWLFTLGNASKTRCPECDQRENAERAGDSGKKMVTILGQSVAIQKELLGLQANGHNGATLHKEINGHRQAAEDPKPKRATRDYTLVVRSERPMIDLLRALQGYGEVVGMSSEIVPEPSPTKPKRSQKPARYRHPYRPDCEWTGFGRRPGWLVEFLQEPGRSIDQCKVAPNGHH